MTPLCTTTVPVTYTVCQYASMPLHTNDTTENTRTTTTAFSDRVYEYTRRIGDSSPKSGLPCAQVIVSNNTGMILDSYLKSNLHNTCMF